MLALAGLAAGCGGGGPSGAATVAAGPSSAAFASYQACLRSHGVTVTFFGAGRPRGGQSGPPPAGSRPRRVFRQPTAKQRAAMTACRSKLPAGARAFGRNGNGPASAAMQKYTACLKAHGVTLGASPAPAATFAKAAAACKSLLPKTAAGTVNNGTSTTG